MRCRSGFHPRKAYTVKRTRVPASCVRRTRETHSTFVARTRGRMTRRLRGIRKTQRGPHRCAAGKIRRAPYVRIRKGRRTFVPASCIADVGAPGKGLASGMPGIGPLRRGNLKQFGYSDVRAMSTGHRQLALSSAVRKYGALTVWRKLNAIYVYTRRTAPASSAIFKADRDWIKATYGIKAV
jgi:hypothetical protein